MSSKILILDNDTNAIGTISELLVLLNFEPIILHNWSNQLKSIQSGALAALFINLELPSLKVDNIVEYFCDSAKKLLIPVFFTYARTFAPAVLKAEKLPHSGKIKKPLKMDELYTLMQQHLKIEPLRCKDSEYQDNLNRFQKNYEGYARWLNNVGNTLFDDKDVA